MQFKDLELSDEILSAVDLLGFTEMTEIQEKSIPIILEGKDVIGRSNTGTGKTAAFGIPVIEKIEKENSDEIQSLILCPTRELAQQACDEIKKFSKFMKWVKPVAIFGGVNIDRQIYQLKRGANLVIGTPGRVIDHINRRTLKLNKLRTIVLDEADEMLQMGFREDIENILKYIPDERQTILFSATMPPEILAITKEYQKDPVLVKTISKSRTVEAIEQTYYPVSAGKKFDALHLLLIDNEPKSAMVFCNTKKMVDELTEMLLSKNFKAVGIHGDMKQSQRTSVMNSFKSGKTSILVATDVAARGIDINGVDAVFNYDLPQDNEYYIHRIGRTGRAGKSGKAFTIVCGKKQVMELNQIARRTKSVITECELPKKSDIINKNILAVTDSLKNSVSDYIAQETYTAFKLLKSEGFSDEDIAVMLLNEKLKETLAEIPDVQTLKYNNINDYKGTRFERNSNSGVATVNINVGRNHKINPNYILGALVDATGMSGKNFGKINIHSDFTTVEVPESKLDYVINSMNNGKINGNKVSVRKSDSKRQNQKQSHQNYKRNRNNKANDKNHINNSKHSTRKYKKKG